MLFIKTKGLKIPIVFLLPDRMLVREKSAELKVFFVYVWFMLVFSVLSVVMVSGYLVMQYWGLYSNNLSVISAGMVRLSIACRVYFLYGMMEVFVGSIRGMGKSFMPMAISLFGICIIRLLWVSTWFRIHHTINDLYYSYPVSWFMTMVLQFMLYLFVYRSNRHC